MDKKEIQNLKHMSREELEKLKRSFEDQLRNLRFDLAAGKVKNINTIKTMKKDIARVHTFLRAFGMKPVEPSPHTR